MGVPLLVGHTDLPKRKTQRMVLGLVAVIILKRNRLNMVLNLLKIIHSFQGNKMAFQ